MLSWITDAFVLLPLRECRYVASHGGSKQNRNRIESTIERISHDRNTTRVAPFHIYIRINSIIFTHIKCIVARRFSNFNFPLFLFILIIIFALRRSIMG